MKVLLIGLDYHSYTQAIADELRLMADWLELDR